MDERDRERASADRARASAKDDRRSSASTRECERECDLGDRHYGD